MDKQKYLAVMLKMMAEGEIRLARQSKSLLTKQAREAAKIIEAGGEFHQVANGIKDWRKLLIAHYATIIKKFSSYIFEQLGFAKSSFEQTANDFIARTALQHSVIINQTTVDLITDAIQRGFNEGLGQNQIAKLIRESVGNTIAAHRARTIARTETHNAATYASQLAAEQSERPLIREWCSAEDERTRAAHLMLMVSNER